jgi:hypothetical protein
MCKWGTDRFIYVIRRNNDVILDGWHRIAVDACIAEYVQEMNNRGVITVGCCCGHGKEEGVVLVAEECISLLDRLGYEYHPFEDRCDVVVHNIPAH